MKKKNSRAHARIETSSRKNSKTAMFIFMALMLMIVSATPISVYSTYLTEVVSTESTADSEASSLAVDADGNVHVAWHDLTDYGGSGFDVDIFYKAKIGGSWTATEVVSTESTYDSVWPSSAVDPVGIVHIAWHDLTDYGGSGIDRDVFYKRVDTIISLSNIMKKLDALESKVDSTKAEVDAIEAKLDDETRFTDDAELSNLETGLHAKLDEILSKLTTAVGGFYIDIDDVAHLLGVVQENLAAVALITAAVIAYLLLMRKMT